MLSADHCGWSKQDIEPGQHTKPHHRKELAAMARKAGGGWWKSTRPRRGWARAKLPFRSRWAVLSSGAHLWRDRAQGQVARGPSAWNSRTYVPRAEKAGYN